MPRSLSQATLDAISAAVVAAMQAQAPARSAASTEASAHYKARDLPCTAATPCGKTFRTTKGRDWHIANVKHGK